MEKLILWKKYYHFQEEAKQKMFFRLRFVKVSVIWPREYKFKQLSLLKIFKML